MALKDDMDGFEEELIEYLDDSQYLKTLPSIAKYAIAEEIVKLADYFFNDK